MWLCLSEGLVRKVRASESISFGREAKAVPPAQALNRRSGGETLDLPVHTMKGSSTGHNDFACSAAFCLIAGLVVHRPGGRWQFLRQTGSRS